MFITNRSFFRVMSELSFTAIKIRKEDFAINSSRDFSGVDNH